MREWVWKTTLKAKMEDENVTQKAWRSMPNGSEHQNGGKWWWIEREIDMRTLSVKLKTWLWTSNWKWGSEIQTEDMALNAEQKKYMMA